MPVTNVAHSVMLTSTVARARVLSMDTSAAERAPGVLKVLTPFNAPELPGAPKPGPQTPPEAPAGGQGGRQQGGQGGQGPAARGAASMRVPTLLQDPYVRYNGQ